MFFYNNLTDVCLFLLVNITNQHLDNCTVFHAPFSLSFNGGVLSFPILYITILMQMDDYQCTYVNDVPPDTYFIPDIENFTVLLSIYTLTLSCRLKVLPVVHFLSCFPFSLQLFI